MAPTNHQQSRASGPRTQAQQQPSAGSSTQTESTAPSAPAPAILRLRGAHPPAQNRVQWAENVVDNEGMGRKSSKVCCIYHAPRAVGESSDESSSSDSSSDSDSDSDTSPSDDPRERALAQRRAKQQQQRRRDTDGHRHGPDCDHDHDHDHGGKSEGDKESGRDARATVKSAKSKTHDRRPSPNAYEKQPKPRNQSGA
ncbi:phosphatase inhibitor-domain-containing protein [Xylariaceae sp. FL0016]|nr:phosphatase inhibitor-domain-containing protein [Xylariaceae sp. FL0016]